jgi:hypothetical protein
LAFATRGDKVCRRQLKVRRKFLVAASTTDATEALSFGLQDPAARASRNQNIRNRHKEAQEAQRLFF